MYRCQVVGLLVFFCMAGMLAIPHVQVARTISIRVVAEWESGPDFARDAVIRINGATVEDWVFTHSTDNTVQETIDTSRDTLIEAFVIFAEDSSYWVALYVDGEQVSLGSHANEANPCRYIIPAEAPPPVCSEGAVNVLEMCPDGYTWSHRQVCRNNAWHDEYQQCPTPPPVCSEGAVNVLETCPDGSWSHRQVCRNNAWHDEYQQCPPPSKDVKFRGTVVSMSPDGIDYEVRIEEILEDPSGILTVGTTALVDVWDSRLIIGGPIQIGDKVEVYGELYNANPAGPGVHVSESYHYIKKIGPVCSEGAVRNVVMCPEGINWKQREVCRNNNWVPEYQTCPIVPTCSEGAVRNVVMCPEGINWKQREVCRNNNWVPEYQQCPTPPHQLFSLGVLVFPQELGLTIHGSGDYSAGETATMKAPSRAADMYLLGWWLDGVPKTLTQEFTVKMDAPHQAAAVYVKPSAYKSIVTGIKKQLVDNIEDVSKEVVEKARQLGRDEHIVDITIDLDLTAMGAIEDYAGWALFAKNSNYFAGKPSFLLSYAFDVAQLGIDVSRCAKKDNCDIDKIKEDLLDFAETNFVATADLLLAWAVCAAVLGVPTAGAGAILCPVATGLIIAALQQVKIGDKNIFEHFASVVDWFTTWIARGICKLVGWILRRTVCTIAGSDVKLLIVDPKGLRTGATLENGQWVMYGEISSSWYGGLESHPQYVVISDPESGNYRLVVTGKGSGSYELQVTSMLDGSVVATQQYSRDIKQGETAEYSSQLMSDGNMIVTPPATWWDLHWLLVLGGAIVVGSAGTFLALERNRSRARRPERSERPRVKEIRSTVGKPRVKSVQETGKRPRVLKVEEE